ncbi:hypothetical protein TNCV_1285781 [Trichonephila clavipes]|uniref:Uncharacterized protein n=1 Tax=Trichonephila clavipes TaxID=2585209 RepID=A0A8X6T022_TRICX|nr:hypothetical protein TNCV_1285781 [Trichonephila clavipes]
MVHYHTGRSTWEITSMNFILTDELDELRQWSLRCPHLILYFFLWEYVKDKIFVHFLPVDLVELKQRTTVAIDRLNSGTLTRVWAEMDYRLNVRRVPKGLHIDHL